MCILENILSTCKLQYSKGSGNYTWSIDNTKLAVVNSAGVVMTKVESTNKARTGSAIVQATDVRNPDHWGVSKVLILPIVEILFVPSPREAQVGNSLDLYLAMHAEVDSSKLHFIWHLFKVCIKVFLRLFILLFIYDC